MHDRSHIWAAVMKAVGFDLVGTLCRAGTREEDCIRELYLELGRNGVSALYQEFVEAYDRVALKYLEIRRTTHREVNNRVWIAEALKNLDLNLGEDNQVLCKAADAYFRPYVESIYVPEYVAPLLSDIRSSFKIGLITNFTHAPAVHDILQRNNLEWLFDSVVISDEIGWRKPHQNIFQRFLNDVSADGPDALFIGDDTKYDIEGAKNVGMRAILLRNKDTMFDETYYTTMEKQNSKPDVTLKSLYQVRDYLLSEV